MPIERVILFLSSIQNSPKQLHPIMKTQLYFLHLFSTKLFLLLISIISAKATDIGPPFYSPVPAAPPTQTSDHFDFIRSSCNATLYPHICYISLIRYANSVQQDPVHLALVAIGVSLSRARRASSFFINLTHRADYGPSPRAPTALRDCCSTFADATDQMHDSLNQMRQLGPAGAEEIRFRLSNVQTWLSAALTNEGTCSDGFADVVDFPLKQNVNDRVSTVSKLTSNALVFVNSLANSVG